MSSEPSTWIESDKMSCEQAAVGVEFQKMLQKSKHMVSNWIGRSNPKPIPPVACGRSGIGPDRFRPEPLQANNTASGNWPEQVDLFRPDLFGDWVWATLPLTTPSCGTSPVRDPPPPKFRFFFPLLPQISFLLSLRGFLVEFGWCLKRRGLHCALLGSRAVV